MGGLWSIPEAGGIQTARAPTISTAGQNSYRNRPILPWQPVRPPSARTDMPRNDVDPSRYI